MCSLGLKTSGASTADVYLFIIVIIAVGINNFIMSGWLTYVRDDWRAITAQVVIQSPPTPGLK